MSLRSAGEQKVKEDDKILWEIETTNRADILLFSNQQNVYKLKASDVTDTKASAMGDYLQNLLGMEPEEKIIYMTTTYDYQGYMVFFFENGKAAKVQLSAYATKNNRKKLLNAYANRSPLLYMEHIQTDKEYLLMRNQDKATVISTELLSVSASKSAVGVQVYQLKQKSAVTAVIPIEHISFDTSYYRSTKIPTTGHFIQEKDKMVF